MWGAASDCPGAASLAPPVGPTSRPTARPGIWCSTSRLLCGRRPQSSLAEVAQQPRYGGEFLGRRPKNQLQVFSSVLLLAFCFVFDFWISLFLEENLFRFCFRFSKISQCFSLNVLRCSWGFPGSSWVRVFPGPGGSQFHRALPGFVCAVQQVLPR